MPVIIENSLNITTEPLNFRRVMFERIFKYVINQYLVARASGQFLIQLGLRIFRTCERFVLHSKCLFVNIFFAYVYAPVSQYRSVRSLKPRESGQTT